MLMLHVDIGVVILGITVHSQVLERALATLIFHADIRVIVHVIAVCTVLNLRLNLFACLSNWKKVVKIGVQKKSSTESGKEAHLSGMSVTVTFVCETVRTQTYVLLNKIN